MAACLLAPGKSTLRNVPDLRDVNTMADMLNHAGATTRREEDRLTIDAAALFPRLLETAVGVTGAEGGSLMLLDEATRELRVRVATDVEQELWPKIRVPLGEGIAGRVAAEGVVNS